MADTVRAGTALAVGMALSDLSITEFWYRYTALGGTRSCAELTAYLSGSAAWPAFAHNLAALALNDYFADHALGPLVAYSYDV